MKARRITMRPMWSCTTAWWAVKYWTWPAKKPSSLAGKKGFGPAVSQQSINAHLVREASRGLLVVRLKGATGYSDVLMKSWSTSSAGISTRLCPVTAAAAAAATCRYHHATESHPGVTFLTAHDASFAEHDWQQLVRSDSRWRSTWAAKQRPSFRAGC